MRFLLKPQLAKINTYGEEHMFGGYETDYVHSQVNNVYKIQSAAFVLKLTGKRTKYHIKSKMAYKKINYFLYK